MKPLTLLLTVVLAISTFALIGQNTATADDTKKSTPATKPADKKKEAPVATPADRVIVMYFHRTQRCPTCKKIGSYVDESVKKEFAKELKAKKVCLYFVDFQQKKNEKLAKSYKITGPTLVLAKVVNNKTAAWKPMPNVWKLVGDKKKFFEYVQTDVKKYLTPDKKKDSTKKDDTKKDDQKKDPKKDK